NFKDIFFHDDINGYIVGNSGALLKSKDFIYPNNDIYTASLSSGGFQAMDIDDNLNGQLDPADMDINTIHFSSRTKGFVAGKYNGAGTTPKGYNRTIEDGAGLISQRFWYDRLGRVAISQNVKQYNSNDYSYTKYDYIGRSIEGGQKKENNSGTQFEDVFGDYVQGYYNPNVISDNNLNAFINNSTGQRTEVTQSIYDHQIAVIQNKLPSNVNQQNIRRRLATISYQSHYDPNYAIYDQATHFSYDIHGNAKIIIQEYPNLPKAHRFKEIIYNYGFIDGLVKETHYQNNAKDAFHHKYEFDKDNRIVKTHTSDNDIHFTNDLTKYYYHNYDLARTELGDIHVQGQDYIKNLQGWIKAVNSNTLDQNRDPGADGEQSTSNANRLFARDACSYSLNFYVDDYRPIDVANKWTNVSNRFESNLYTSSNLIQDRNELYNGIPSSVTTTIRNPDDYSVLPNAFAYEHDELNRMLYANSWDNIDLSTNEWQSNGTNQHKYENRLRYDANGNIEYQQRRNAQGQIVDQLQYEYNVSSNGKKLQNRLYYVNESIAENSFIDDIDDQSNFNIPGMPIEEGSNYRYNALGELSKSLSEEIDTILWRVDSKIKEIKRIPNSSKSNLKFDYDTRGERIAKHQYTSSGTWLKSTYYVRDFTGNIIAVYEEKFAKNPIQIGGVISKQKTFTLIERNLFETNRFGKYSKKVTLIGGIKEAQNPISNITPISIGKKGIEPDLTNLSHIKGKNQPSERYIGQRQYELCNHLNNVISVVSDKKIAIDDTQDGNIDFYMPDILIARDYSPFGAVLDERNFVKGPHRFSFQAQEKDDEIYGADNAINYKYRIHDPRLGRFQSIDPLHNKYPALSPYAFSGNNVVGSIELEGLEPFWVIGTNQSPDDVTEDERTLAQFLVNHVATSAHSELECVPINYCFDWSEEAGLYNETMNTSEPHREAAAQRLAEYVIDNHVEGEPVTLIGYSHGGNVSAQAAPIISAALSEKYNNITEVNIISVNTPASNATGPTYDLYTKVGIIEKHDTRWRESPFNPVVQNSVNNWLHLYNSRDMVVWASGKLERSEHFYDSDRVVNFKYSTPYIRTPLIGDTESHYESIYRSSNIIEQLTKAINEGTISRQSDPQNINPFDIRDRRE
ncbi:MAG: hypothetical protein MRY83_00245, partial [Flavobacteriales bacterium]|nr:hypothetical protein [Flavobacteriales bacterium]